MLYHSDIKSSKKSEECGKLKHAYCKAAAFPLMISSLGDMFYLFFEKSLNWYE